MKLNPYIHYQGQCAEAFAFYAKCLGGEVMALKFSDAPTEQPVDPAWRDRIMHAQLEAGDVVLMGCDAPPEHYQTPQGIAITLNVDTVAEAERLFPLLSQGGTVHMALQPTFWAERFGMFNDRFGIAWMINGAVKQV